MSHGMRADLHESAMSKERAISMAMQRRLKIVCLINQRVLRMRHLDPFCTSTSHRRTRKNLKFSERAIIRDGTVQQLAPCTEYVPRKDDGVSNAESGLNAAMHQCGRMK